MYEKSLRELIVRKYGVDSPPCLVDSPPKIKILILCRNAVVVHSRHCFCINLPQCIGFESDCDDL